MSKKKPRRKLKLPVDRHGTPIDVGDYVEWEDELVKVETLTYLGREFEDTVGAWIINVETDCADNPEGGVVVKKGAK